jgi:hypothetical protein
MESINGLLINGTPSTYLNVRFIAFNFKDGKQRYKFTDLGQDLTYFSNHEAKNKKIFSSHQYIGVLHGHFAAFIL